ncbi:MAG: phosphoribosylglycinamide formyltransferase [Geobacteraceae bacterium]
MSESSAAHQSELRGKEKVRVAVLVSGNGSNLQSIIDHCEAGKINAAIVCVISNRVDAYALERARKHRIPAFHLNHRDFPDRESFDAALLSIVNEHEAQLIALAGFNRILSHVLLDAFPAEILNIHPALLPSFPGSHAQRTALEYGVRIAGCTVHFVDSGTDTGPIIAQAAVPVFSSDSEETLSRRILCEEHKIYPRVLQLYTEGRIHLDGRKVVISPETEYSEDFLENPRF